MVHWMDFEHTWILSTIKPYHPRIYKEVKEIQKYKNNMNWKEETLSIKYCLATCPHKMWECGTISKDIQDDKQGELSGPPLRTNEHRDDPLDN